MTIDILTRLRKRVKKEPEKCRIDAEDFQKRLLSSLRQKNCLTHRFRRRLESVGE